MLSRFTHDLIAAPLKSSRLVSSSSIHASLRSTRSSSSSSVIKRLSNAAGVSTLAARASTSTSCAARTDDHHHGASRKKPTPKKKSKPAVVRGGKYKRPATFIGPVAIRIVRSFFFFVVVEFTHVLSKSYLPMGTNPNHVFFNIVSTPPDHCLHSSPNELRKCHRLRPMGPQNRRSRGDSAQTRSLEQQ